MKLESARTIIRPFTIDDYKVVEGIFTNENICKQIGFPILKRKEDINRMLEQMISLNMHKAIEMKESQQVVGFIAIEPDFISNNKNNRELGFAILEEYQNEGIMSEVIRAIVNYLLLEENTETIYLRCFQDNLACQKLAKKCGFIFMKEDVFCIPGINQIVPDYVYYISKQTG